MTMDENRGSVLERKTDSMELESKEIYELHDSSRDITEANGRDECRKNHKVTDELSVDNASKTVDSPKKEGQNGRSHNPRDREHKFLMTVEEHVDYKENKSRDSSTPHNDSSCLVKAETDLFADKNMLHTSSPDLEVCYKEIDQHTVKDICVDEGKPEKGSIVNESDKEDKPGNFLPQPAIDKAKEGFNKEIFTSEEEEISLHKNPNVVCSDHRGSEEQKVSRIDSVPSGEANFSMTGETATESPEDLSPMDKKIPVVEIGTRGFIKSLLESLDGEENAAKQWPAQIADKTAVSQSLAMALVNEDMQQEVVRCSSPSDNNLVESDVETRATEDVKEQLVTSGEAHAHKDRNTERGIETGTTEEVVLCSSPSDNNLVQSGIETSTSGDVKEQLVTSGEAHDHKDKNAESGIETRTTKDVKEQSVTSGEVHDHKDKNAESGIKTRTTEDVKEQSVTSGEVHDHKDKNAESGIETRTTEDVKEQSVTSREVHDHKDKNAGNLSADDQIQPGDKSRSSTKDKEQMITNPDVPKHERWTSDSASIMGRMQKDDGETSFSAASLINYSEPVPFSGSISHRSDSSATSTRSFAFPVLQSEWNSSPVRMAKADRRRLRKQRCWRSGVFCCRF